MISRRIPINPTHDRYPRLAAYIADAGHGGEKCLMAWCAGCLGGEDYAEGVAEVADVQDCNTRAQGAKTYHLLVSFRPEDETRLAPEVFQDIERRFAAALGYAEHQRHCGVHRDTANIHMHVAYNMIHPGTYTVHKEFRDYWIRDKLCRELEREYGLHIDNGREQLGKDRINDKAAAMEAHSGQQSFVSYAKSHAENLQAALAGAGTWEEVHAAFARYGLEIRPRANGLIVRDRHSKNANRAAKASDVAKGFSLKKLQSRFGPFVPPLAPERFTGQDRYEAATLCRGPHRGELFQEYKRGIENRIACLQTLKEKEDATLDAIRRKWEVKRNELDRLNIAKRNRRNLIAIARKREAEEKANARLSFQEPRQEVRREIPYASWTAFLQWKTEQGNETALSMLRSHAGGAEPEREQRPPDVASLRAQFATRERNAQEAPGVSGKGKTRLLAALRMERLVAEERQRHGENTPCMFDGITCRVDGKGVVIFTIPTGGTVRDTGKTVLFSAGDATAREAAKRYAQSKWGLRIVMEENGFSLGKERARERGGR